MTSNFPSCYQGVPNHHCVIKGPPLWPQISYHVIKGSHHCVIKGPPFSPSRHQRDPNFQNTSWDVYRYLKSYNRDKSVHSLSRGVCEGGVNGYEVRGGAPESPLSMGHEHPRYATGWLCIARWKGVLTPSPCGEGSTRKYSCAFKGKKL